jgi:hypothetical protein
MCGIGGLATDVTLEADRQRCIDCKRHSLPCVDRDRSADAPLDTADNQATDASAARDLLLSSEQSLSMSAKVATHPRELLAVPPVSLDAEGGSLTPGHDHHMIILGASLPLTSLK